MRRTGERGEGKFERITWEEAYKEIAEITGLTTNNVGVSLHAAMKKLASILDKKGGDYV